MAHGAPDWWSRAHIDIIAQALAYLEQRPMYGEAKMVEGDVLISANSSGTLVQITGKGKLYSGYIRIVTDHSVKKDAIRWYIDGNLIYETTWWDFIRFGASRPYESLMWANCYDEVNNYFTAGLMSDITFEESLKLTYENNSDYNVIVYCNLTYTLMQT